MILVTQGYGDGLLVTQGYTGAAVPPPPPPSQPSPTPTALAESSGAHGGYLVPTEWGQDRRSMDVLYPPGTGWTGRLDDVPEREAERVGNLRTRQRLVATALLVLGDDELL